MNMNVIYGGGYCLKILYGLPTESVDLIDKKYLRIDEVKSGLYLRNPADSCKGSEEKK